MVDRGWGATMVLTEPDAGSDVGAGRTKAIPNEDGSWNIEGVKRFITSAEHDLAENIMHLVLARPEGVEGVGGPGTKGLSLFLVPKFHFDHETGELTGERNGAYVTNVEKKMGIKVSTTCEVTFGDGAARRQGWLLGEVHDGINQMFRVIENARMMVGAKAIATLSTGYLNALDYAKERVQGADLTQAADKTAPRVTITHHPDVRRSLLTQKAFAEGLRSLMIYAATWQDEVMIKEAAGEDTALSRGGQRPAAAARQGLRLGALVGAAGHRVAADLRRLGLPAGLPDRAVRPRRQDRHPLRGHHGDPGPGPVLPQDREGQGPGARLPVQRDQGVRRERGRQRSPQGRARAARARASRTRRPSSARCSPTSWPPTRPRRTATLANIYKVGLNTTRLVYVLGDLVVAWLLLRGAEVALDKLGGGVSGADKTFYEGKVAAASFFARNVLPQLAGERAIAENIDDSTSWSSTRPRSDRR